MSWRTYGVASMFNSFMCRRIWISQWNFDAMGWSSYLLVVGVGRFLFLHWSKIWSIIKKWLISSIYGPDNYQRRGNFWRKLDGTRGRLSRPWFNRGRLECYQVYEWKVELPFVANIRHFSGWINSHSLNAHSLVERGTLSPAIKPYF